MDDHTDGKPYGVDVLIPENISTAGEKNVTWKSLEARISPEHRDFTRNLLKKYDIELATTNVADNQPQPFDGERALELLDVSFRHPIRLIANALGVPPQAMIDMGQLPWRRRSHHGAGGRGDQGDCADPRPAGAGRRRHHDRTADGGLHGDGRCGCLDRFGVAPRRRI